MGQGLTAGPLDPGSREPWARVLRPTRSQGSRRWREEGTRGEEVGPRWALRCPCGRVRCSPNGSPSRPPHCQERTASDPEGRAWAP